MMLEDLIPRAAAPPQSGILSGANPSAYNANDPIQLWIIQVAIIVCFTQLLSLGLARIRQPRVIAEVIGGILLGPTVMGRIPHFTNRIFPAASIPLLTLTANIGLVMFLFLIGLEVDLRIMTRNAKQSLTISIAGMVLPFGLGVAVAVPIYNEFIDKSNNFGHFLLFVGVAIAITAFPVLCRILTDLKLLDTTVGSVVLAAGVGNDVVGWILLALTVALVNASSGLTALWVLLIAVGWTLLLLFPIKWGILWLARRTRSIQSGQPTTLMMTVILLLVFASALFTDIIGVHPIFGAFLAGIAIPREGGFAIGLVEKLEDLVLIIFVPLYFASSGLKTNLGLLDNGKTWGYVVLICTMAFCGKFIGCAVAARLSGFTYRESGAIGTLMSCKGLVELIVLNVGLQAGILDTRVFSMFVVHALVLTCMTTPLTLWIYPARIRKNVAPFVVAEAAPVSSLEDGKEQPLQTWNSFSVILDVIDHLPAALTLTQLLQTQNSGAPSRASSDVKLSPTSIHALRLIELTERTSAVMKSSATDELVRRDPMISVFRTFGTMHGATVDAVLSVVEHDEFSPTITTHARDVGANMVIVPWSTGPGQENVAGHFNPFDGVFGRTEDRTWIAYSNFLRKLFADSPLDLGVFVDCGGLASSVSAGQQYHIFVPFFGGPDDRLALTFAMQLVKTGTANATVVRMLKGDSEDAVNTNQLTVQSVAATHYPTSNTQTRLQSDTADNLLWSQVTGPSGQTLSVTFSESTSNSPLEDTIKRIESDAVDTKKSVLVMLGRGKRLARVSHRAELLKRGSEAVDKEVAKSVGDAAAAIIRAGLHINMLVVQAVYGAS